MSTYRQPAIPHVYETETGFQFCPEYETTRQAFPILPADWKHVCPCRFGEARGGTNRKWSGDSYRYDIFRKGEQWALRWWNGAGQGWFTMPHQLSGESLPLEHVATLPEERRWDFCHFLWQIAHKTAQAVARKTSCTYEQAFIQGRLKKKKRNNRFTVEILPDPLDTIQTTTTRTP